MTRMKPPVDPVRVAASLDCQPKSADDAVLVSQKWRDGILKALALGGLDRVAAGTDGTVAGRYLTISISDFVRRCETMIKAEQENPTCDSRLIGTLCESVRLAREYSDAAVQPILIGLPVFVVSHEGCADEPGPAPVPVSLDVESEDEDGTVDAVAFTTREDAERALASAWPGGTVEEMRLVP